MQDATRLKYLFQRNLNYLMDNHGRMSKYKLAKELDVSETTAGNWCSGRTTPYPKDQLKIAELFHVAIGDLFSEDFPPIIKEQKNPVPQTGDGQYENYEIEIINALRKLPQSQRVAAANNVKFFLLGMSYQDADGEDSKSLSLPQSE